MSCAESLPPRLAEVLWLYPASAFLSFGSRDDPCVQNEEVMELMGWMLLATEGFSNLGGKLPEWARSMRGWRWSFHFAEKDSKRCRITTDELVRLPWTVRA